MTRSSGTDVFERTFPPAPARRMRIALLIEALCGGGAEAVVQQLAAGLARRGQRAFVYCLKNAGAPLDQLTAAGVTIREANSAGRDPLLAARLFRWFRQDAIELANSHNSAATVWALPAAKALRIPLVQTRHGGLLGRPPRYARLADLSAPLLDAVTIVAEPLRQTLPRLLAPRALCIPNGIDLEPLSPPDARRNLEQVCGRALRGPVVLSVGAICPEKDVCNLLRAFALLHKTLPGATLVHVGAPRSPAYARLVSAQAQRLELNAHIVFTGKIAQPWRIMGGADVFCLSSATEAMPLALIEAMSQRVPIVATEVGAVGRLDPPAAGPEQPPTCLLVHERSGLLVPPGEPRELAQALQRTLRDRRAATRRVERALVDYRRWFSFAPMISSYERLYASLIRERAARRASRPHSPVRPNVLMVGPGPGRIGGMTSVIDQLMSGPLNKRFQLHRYWPPLPVAGRNGPRRRSPFDWSASVARHLAALWGLAHTLRRTRSQIVHVHTCSFLSFYRSMLDILLAKLLGRRTCLHIHGGRFDEFCANSGRVTRWIIRRGCELADSVIVLAPCWAARLRPFVGQARIDAVPNGVVVPDSLPGRARGVRAACRFAYLGALCPGKGLDDLLAAAAQLRNKNVPFELILAGPTDPPTEHWQQTVRQRGLVNCVRFAGPICGAAKADLLAWADCLVLPSRHEGLPMVLLEAGAAGLPVIATAVGAIPELLSPARPAPEFAGGGEGLAPMVGPGDVNSLAREMLRLARDPDLRRQIGRRLHARVRQRYSVDRVAQNIAAIYLRLLHLAGNPPPDYYPAPPGDRSRVETGAHPKGGLPTPGSSPRQPEVADVPSHRSAGKKPSHRSTELQVQPR